MKRNNVAKAFGIASLCLATAISAFSGISSFKNDSVVLAEDTGTVALSDFVTVSEGATVAQETRTVYTKKNSGSANQNCLRISSDVPYEATFNQVFYGNSEFRFSFPNERPEGVDTTLYWGDFRYRITDAADENNFFDIVYTTTTKGTTVYVEWNGHTVQAYTGTTAGANVTAGYYRDTIGTGSSTNSTNYAPAFFGYDPTHSYDTREGKLGLIWSGEVLWVTANSTRSQDTSDCIAMIVAKFDGTYDSTASNQGFVAKSKWGFPKMTFPNGYKVSFSSSYTNENTTDQATDVSFWRIKNNGTINSNEVVQTDGAYYTAFSDTAFTKNNYMQAYDLMEENASKTLLGWKDAEGALHSTDTALASSDISAYTPVFLGFDRIAGASVRIDTSEGGKSGLRFITGFNPDDYAALLETGYVTSFGTLLAYKESLVQGIFDVVNYATELAVETDKKVVQVASGSNGGSTFEYTQGGVTYTAYSVALVDLTDYTQEYSARGYIVVAYADGTTATLYTAFNETNNTRSIAQTAYNLKTIGAAEYNTYTAAQQAIVDTYAAPLETAE